MQQAQLIAMWFAMALYAGATVLYVYYFLEKRRVISWYATFLTGAGFLFQTAAIIFGWIATGRFPVAGPFNSLLLAAWGLVAVYFVVEHLVKVKVLGTLLLPVAVVALVTAQIVGPAASVKPIVQGWLVGIHVTLLALANAGFAVAAGSSILYLVQETQLKRHHTSVLLKRLPSLGQADALANTAVIWAYPTYTAGLLLGVLRAVDKLHGNWWLDPRVMVAGVVWLIFGVYLYLRYRGTLSTRGAAYLALAGFMVVIILFVVVRVAPGPLTGFA